MALGRRTPDCRGVSVVLGRGLPAWVVVVLITRVVIILVPVSSRRPIPIALVPAGRRVSMIIVAVSASGPAGQVVCEGRHSCVSVVLH